MFGLYIKVAEARGFEPPVPIKGYDNLANCCLKPNSATLPENGVKI